MYHRPNVGQGKFTALATTFDSVNETLTVTNASLGEYVFGYPDTPEIAYAPTLRAPEDAGTVNQDQPVTLEWNANGFFRSFALQVATDARFRHLILNESGLKQSSYELASVDPGTTCYWRVSTTNYGGISEWATGSFQAVAPMIAVAAPNGGEQWQRGLDFFILWDDNLPEDVVLELYKSDVFLRVIDTVASTGVYEWEVDLDLEPGGDYSIKIKSSVDELLFDMSDETFSID